MIGRRTARKISLHRPLPGLVRAPRIDAQGSAGRVDGERHVGIGVGDKVVGSARADIGYLGSKRPRKLVLYREVEFLRHLILQVLIDGSVERIGQRSAGSNPGKWIADREIGHLLRWIGG